MSGTMRSWPTTTGMWWPSWCSTGCGGTVWATSLGRLDPHLNMTLAALSRQANRALLRRYFKSRLGIVVQERLERPVA